MDRLEIKGKVNTAICYVQSKSLQGINHGELQENNGGSLYILS